MRQNIKLYLVRFCDKKTNDSFYKIGITSKYDVLERFNYDEYDDWNISVMASAYGPRAEVEQAEEDLKKRFPKNLWIEKKISGVTELVRLSSRNYNTCMQMICDYNNEWHTKRKSNKQQTEKE